MRILRLLVGLFGLAACGSGGTPHESPLVVASPTAVVASTPTPTQTGSPVCTPTVGPLPTVTSTGRIRYRVVEGADPFSEGSRLLFSETFTSPPTVLSLTGSFAVIPVAPLPPNTTLALQIVDVAFTAGPFVIEGHGDIGLISVTTLDPAQPLSAAVQVTITQPFTHQVWDLELTGTGSADTFTTDFPAAFSRVTVSSEANLWSFGLFSLDIVAVPEAAAASP